MLNLEWLDTEQNFLHQRVLRDARKLDKEQLIEVFEMIHRQHLLHKRLFSALSSWCVRSGVMLPPLTELLTPREVDHPLKRNSTKCSSSSNGE